MNILVSADVTRVLRCASVGFFQMFSGAAGKIVALDHLVISVVQTVDRSKGCGFDSQRMHALENMHIVLIAT